MTEEVWITVAKFQELLRVAETLYPDWKDSTSSLVVTDEGLRIAISKHPECVESIRLVNKTSFSSWDFNKNPQQFNPQAHTFTALVLRNVIRLVMVFGKELYALQKVKETMNDD